MSEKVEKCLEVFYKQPSMVIQWAPDKQHYSWGLVGPSRAENMLKEILEILLNGGSKDE